MKIQNFRTEEQTDTKRVLATIVWEDCNRPKQDIYFATSRAFSEALSCNPHAFLVAGILPAMRSGEERVFIEADICPELAEGLATVMALLRHWYDPSRKLVRIEPSGWFKSVSPCKRERAGFFFSGGIDSLAVLRRNRLRFALEHPRSFKDGILVYGLNFDSDDRPETFHHAVNELSVVAQDAQIRLVPVETNLRRELNPDLKDAQFWLYEFQSAGLAAVAHALTGTLNAASIASSHDFPHLMPFGTHPLVDPNYSSGNMRLYHEDVALSRFAKTKLLVDWEAGLQNIKVCPRNWPGVNCGVCEKCIRTMLALLALGALERTRAFPKKSFGTEDIHEAIKTPYANTHYEELIEPLEAIGREDLAHAIRYAQARFRGETGFKGALRRLDHKFFDGGLAKFKRTVFMQMRQPTPGPMYHRSTAPHI